MERHPKEELLSALADGRLDVGSTHRVAEHLRGCDQCRATLADFERNKALFGALPGPAMPAEQFWDDTFRRMRVANIDAPASNNVPRFQALRMRAVLASAACLAVAIFIPLTLRVPQDASPKHTPVSAAPADTVDSADISSFVLAHTESVAGQPLSDPERQRMIAADAVVASDDQAPEAAVNADVSP